MNFKKNYLSQEALENMKKYKYISCEASILDKWLNPFWNWAVELLPMWLAPNMVTLLGLLITCASVYPYLAVDYTMTEKFPPECYYFSALSVFLYQLLDAIDGKQARRTGSSSPLGQLFDHGVDAIQIGLNIFTIGQIMQQGSSKPLLILYGCLLHSFFSCQWEEFHTGILRTNAEGVGLTEMQCFIMFVFTLQGLSGGVIPDIKLKHIGSMFAPQMDENIVQSKIQGFVDSTNLNLGYTLDKQKVEKLCHLLTTIADFKIVNVLIMVGIVTMFAVFYKSYKAVKQSGQRNTSDFQIFQEYLPMLVSYVYIATCFMLSPISWTYPVFVIFSVHPYFCTQNSRLIIATVTRQRYSFFDDIHLSYSMMLSILALVVNYHLDFPIKESNMFAMILLGGLATYFWYILHSIDQIKKFLGVNCLTIPYKKKTV